jgi:hypothetical protein
MVPAVMPLLLLMLPAMLTALAVVREKELGSILNLYVTPVTRTEFLLGKQLPYVGLALLNFALMSLLAVTVFGVPITGSFATLALARRCSASAPPAGPAGLDRHAQPDRRHVLHHDRHHDAGGAVLRPAQPGQLAGGAGHLIGRSTRPPTCSPSAAACSARACRWPICRARSGRCC